MHVVSSSPQLRRRLGARMLTMCAGLVIATVALAATLGHGVLVHLQANQVASFDTRHNVQSVRLNPNRDLYLITATDGRTDKQLLQEIKTDPHAVNPTLNTMVTLGQSTASVLNGQSTASVLNGQSTASVLNGQSTASVLNGQSTASVLNGETVAIETQSTASVLNQSTASVLNGEVNFYGERAPSQYVNQPTVGQVDGGVRAHRLATGRGVVVALIDNGVDQFNPLLEDVLLGREGYNFFDNTPDWSAWADLGQSTASVLNGQSTASVLNGGLSGLDGQSTASVLNNGAFLRWLQAQSTASVLNGCPVPTTGGNSSSGSGSQTSGLSSTTATLQQSTASVLNGQGTTSARNLEEQLLLQLVERILACDPDFGHGTSVAGLIHLIAPEAKILPIKAFGPGGTADAAVIYQSLTYAIDRGAQVINLSFSSSGLDPNVQAAIAEAVSKGIIVAAAAGNGGISDPVFPAALPGVVGVGAVDGCNAPTVPAPAPGTVNPCIANPVLFRAGFSNFDPPSGIVDDWVGAPGVQLYSTFPGFGLLWATVTGTSFSTPVVAGEAALLAELGQTGSINRDLIAFTANPAIPGDSDGGLGYGLVQVLGALRTVPANNHGHGKNGH